MSKYNIFVVSPSDLPAVVNQLEVSTNPKVKSSKTSVSFSQPESTAIPTHECLAYSHKVELNNLTKSAKMMFKFHDLKRHLTDIQDLPIHNQALSAYLRKNNYHTLKIKDPSANTVITVWKHKTNKLFI